MEPAVGKAAAASPVHKRVEHRYHVGVPLAPPTVAVPFTPTGIHLVIPAIFLDRCPRVPPQRLQNLQLLRRLRVKRFGPLHNLQRDPGVRHDVVPDHDPRERPLAYHPPDCVPIVEDIARLRGGAQRAPRGIRLEPGARRGLIRRTEPTAARGRRGRRPGARAPNAPRVVVLAVDSFVHVYEVHGAELTKGERLRGRRRRPEYPLVRERSALRG
mmetsp:Transcript_14326/g.60601  ORF Transcript_14326/g.60601 Transcript_14326/m.60601 type:complete len:214 (-) Transcript_14326:418-1059(-)